MEMYKYELMIEWGLTPDEFDNIDVEHIYRILEYRQAKSKGQSTKK